MRTVTQVQRDWKWSDRFLPEIRSIIGPHILETASLEMDRNCASDLMVLRGRDAMIACRVRRSEYGDRYANQFTLRFKRPSGTSTEFEKITNGWGDFLLYAFAENESDHLTHWRLIDLHAFRAHLIRNRKCLGWGIRKNPDGTEFIWFDLEKFPIAPPILIASSSH